MVTKHQRRIEWQSGPLIVTLDIDPEGHPLLRSVRPSSGKPLDPVSPDADPAIPLTEIRLAGEGNDVRPGTSKRAMGTCLGRRLRYVKHNEYQAGEMAGLDVESHDSVTGITVINHFIVYARAPVLRASTEVRNDSNLENVLQMVSSLSIGGLTSGSEKWWDDYRVRYANSSWFREAQWVERTLPDLGLDNVAVKSVGHPTTRALFALGNNGSFSTNGHLAMGALERTDGGKTWLWQIENNGGWRWEIGDYEESIYLVATGPTDADNHWMKVLQSGESFHSVPVAIAAVDAPAEVSFQAMTEYRRCMRRKHADNETLPIIFNDFMNCLMGDPTTEKVVALIEPAAKAGAEYFCIDCGWYADDAGWWITVGEWKESKSRFPEGLSFVLNKIRQAGMKPGLWIEPEVMGVNCPDVDNLPHEAFFQRNGQKVIEQGRYQLDYRHPAVIERMDSVIDRLVREYGAQYFKFDYNIDVTEHTDIACASPGEAALDHNRAYLAWVNRIMDIYPDLVIENCSSGGQRLDYAQLGTHPIQSTSDQQDPVMYAAISASVPTAVTPEQSASWAYPQPDWSDETIALTVVNSILGRVHLSGLLHGLSEKQLALVEKGMAVYKNIRLDLKRAVPFWPLGLPRWSDDWVALGMDAGHVKYISVWRRSGKQTCELTIPSCQGRSLIAERLYPSGMVSDTTWDEQSGVLHVELPEAPSARLFRLL